MSSSALHSGMLLEHIDGLVNIKLCDANSSPVVVSQLLQLGLVLASQPTIR